MKKETIQLRHLWVIVILLTGTPGFFWAASNPDGYGEELIKDPGFENPSARFWVINNWAKNQIDSDLDSQRPHSGKNSMRIGIVKVAGSANSLLMQSLPLSVKPGMALDIKLWSRGHINMGAFQVQVRKMGSPYTSYWSSEISPTEDWSEQVFQVTLPENIDTDGTALYVTVKNEMSIWIDDVSIRSLPNRDPSPALAGNLIKNGSFEVGRAHWYGMFRETGGYEKADEAGEKNYRSSSFSEEGTDAPNGKKVAHLGVGENCLGAMSSAFFKMRYGAPAVLSFYLKTSRPKLPITVKVDGGKFPNSVTSLSRVVSTKGTDWEKFEIPFTPLPVSGKVYVLKFVGASPGDFWFDAVNIHEGEKSLPYEPQKINLGWLIAESGHEGNIFYKDEPVKMKILAECAKGVGAVRLKSRIVDVWGKEIQQDEFTIPLDPNGRGESVLNFPSASYGGFNVEFFEQKEKVESVPLCDFYYNVAPKLKDPKEVADSFFGAHFSYNPYNLRIAKLAGFRWLRLHPPLTTKWPVTEPKPGVYNYAKTGIVRAKSEGFKILGSLCSVPTFHADIDPGKTSEVFASYPPKDWDQWKSYVHRTITEYKDEIDTWEIWNEPNSSGFLNLRPGVDRVEVCLNLVKYTQQAVEENKHRVALIGFGMASCKADLNEKLLAAGAAGFIDAYGVHFYNGEIGPDEAPGNPTLNEFVQKINTFKSRKGGNLECWMTEGGIFLTGGKSFLRSDQVPPSSAMDQLTACNALVRTIASLKAIGCKKHFHYLSFAHETGRALTRDECEGMLNPDGTPYGSLTAHATSVYFLEDAEPRKFEEKKIGSSKVCLARFVKSGKNLDVIWSRVPLTFKEAGMDLSSSFAFDMMGNQVALGPESMITLTPYYLLEK